MKALTIRGAWLIAFSAAAFSGTVHAAANPSVTNDLARLQGTWKMVSGIADGQAMPDGMLGQARRVCKGDELTVTIASQTILKAKFTIDPAKKPKTIDYQVIDGPNKGKRQLGIYEIDGDTLRSCFAAPAAERPKDFTSRPGDMRTSSVWKREKEAAPKPY